MDSLLVPGEVGETSCFRRMAGSHSWLKGGIIQLAEGQLTAKLAGIIISDILVAFMREIRAILNQKANRLEYVKLPPLICIFLMSNFITKLG